MTPFDGKEEQPMRYRARGYQKNGTNAYIARDDIIIMIMKLIDFSIS